MNGNEVELIDYIRVVQKKKWLIILGTAAFVAVALLASFLARPVYEIDTIIQPGKLLLENQNGEIRELVIEDARQVAYKVRHGSYDDLISTELGLDRAEIQEVEAENIPRTILTRMWLRGADVEQQKQILHSLIQHLKKDMDAKIHIEISNVDFQIEQFEIETARSEQEIEILKKRIAIIAQRKKDIMNEIGSLRARIKELESEQLKALKNETRSEVESLSLLLYSNEVQQSFIYLDLLNEKLSEMKLEEETHRSDIETETAEIKINTASIAILKERKGRFDYMKVIKEPTASRYPVYPKKKLMAVFAFITGLVFFTLLGFFLNYVENKKNVE
jgi:LPS O-antigen subunit length determinant protein (WzzB/FepE family)